MNEERQWFTWEDTWTGEEMQRVSSFFLHDKGEGTYLCLISTKKDGWLAKWWEETIKRYQEVSLPHEDDKEEGEERCSLFTEAII